MSIAEKRQNRAKYLTQNSIRFHSLISFLSKKPWIYQVPTLVALDLLKAQAISDTIVKRSAVDQEYVQVTRFIISKT